MRGLSGKYHPLHLGAAAGAVVDGEDRALDLLVPVRGLEAGGQLPAEHGDALLPPDAQDRVKASGHAHVGDVARPPGEDALVETAGGFAEDYKRLLAASAAAITAAIMMLV